MILHTNALSAMLRVVPVGVLGKNLIGIQRIPF
jgi:hypothetical protein